MRTTACRPEEVCAELAAEKKKNTQRWGEEKPINAVHGRLSEGWKRPLKNTSKNIWMSRGAGCRDHVHQGGASQLRASLNREKRRCGQGLNLRSRRSKVRQAAKENAGNGVACFALVADVGGHDTERVRALAGEDDAAVVADSFEFAGCCWQCGGLREDCAGCNFLCGPTTD